MKQTKDWKKHIKEELKEVKAKDKKIRQGYFSMRELLKLFKKKLELQEKKYSRLISSIVQDEQKSKVVNKELILLCAVREECKDWLKEFNDLFSYFLNK